MKKEVFLISIAVLFLAGCQAMPYKPYARRVKMKPRVGGVVALKLDHNEQDRQHAEGMMSKSCGAKKFAVLEEGEVVIGTETKSNETRKAGTEGKKMGSLFGIPLTSAGTDPSKATSSTTLQKKEWQIKYKCS